MTTPLDDLQVTFKANASSVLELFKFDQAVLAIPIQELKRLQTALKEAKITNPNLGVDRSLKLLTDIQKNDSLKSLYRDLYNHGLVLLASYFASAVNDFFRRALVIALEDGSNSALREKEIKLPLGALRSQGELFEDLGDFIIRNEKWNFQDTQTISKACKEFLGFELSRDSDVNNIILGLAYRHALVHNGGRIDRKLLKQVRDCEPRTLVVTPKLDDHIEISVEQLQIVIGSMEVYLSKLAGTFMRKLEGRA